MKIKKGDKVKVITGKDRGKESVVERVIASKDLIVVEGVNILKKHVKATNDRKGGIISLTKPIHVSNVMLICPKCLKTARVSYNTVDGKKYRVCSKCKEVL